MEEPSHNRRKQCRPGRQQLQPLEDLFDTVFGAHTSADQKPTTSTTNKLIKDEPQDTESTSENLQQILDQVQEMIEDGVKREPVDDIDVCSTIEADDIPKGRIIGPFPYRLLSAEEEDENVVVLQEQHGTALRLQLFSEDPLLHKLTTSTSLEECNCTAILHSGQLFLYSLRDVPREESLVAQVLSDIQLPSTSATLKPETDAPTKKFACDRCHRAKFSAYETLLAHQEHYCKGQATQTSTNGFIPNPPSTPLPPVTPSTQQPTVQLPHPLLAPLNVPPFAPLPTSAALTVPNVLFLPLAYHDHQQANVVQLIGPPQTIVPVAIGRRDSLRPSPIILSTQLSTPSSATITAGDVHFTLPIFTLKEESRVAPQPTPTKRPSSEAIGTPLDLSKRQKSDNSPDTSPGLPYTVLPAPAPIISNVPQVSTSKTPDDSSKPWKCSCGVSFSAELTLIAHQRQYCRNTVRNGNSPHRESPRKIPSRCPQCDFEPNSVSQLSVHIRSVHNEVQAYICKVCGYKGYSQRGIRAHLRSHPQLGAFKVEALMTTHVNRQVKGHKSEDTEDGTDSPMDSISTVD